MRIYLFAGTLEGRKIAEYLKTAPLNTTVFTATEYGRSLISESAQLRVENGRLDEEGMLHRFRKDDPVMGDSMPPAADYGRALILDATHPYAQLVTGNIQAAARRANIPYVRILRSSTYQKDDHDLNFASTADAASFLEHTAGSVLLTTGSKELKDFTTLTNYKERLYARVLPLPKVIAACWALGFTGKHLIGMQGPFTEEMNVALLHMTKAAFLVTKDTGTAGGFREKQLAAKAAGVRLIVIGRPNQEENGISLEEALSLLDELVKKERTTDE